MDQHKASPVMQIAGVTIDCDDPAAMASFYAQALAGVISDEDETGAQVRLADDQLLLFRHVVDYRRPTWPSQELPIQLHFEYYVDDVRIAEAQLQRLGATTAQFQDQDDADLIVMLDPAGHPFCIISVPKRQRRTTVTAAVDCVCWASVAWRGRWGLGSLPDQDGWLQHDDAVRSGGAGVVLRRRRRWGWRVERHVRIHRDPRFDRREAWVDDIVGSDGRGSGDSGRRACGWAFAGARARTTRGGARRATHDGYGNEARAQSRRH